MKTKNKIQYQLDYHLKILFIGINPHPGSYSRGVPFSNNKMFWYLLHDAGLINEPRELLKNDAALKHLYMHTFTQVYRFGLLNMVDRPTRTTTALKKEEALPGRVRLLKAIHTYEPAVVCFVGKVAYRMFSGLHDVSYGWQPSINKSKLYVMHAPHHGFAHVRVHELKIVYRASMKNN